MKELLIKVDTAAEFSLLQGLAFKAGYKWKDMGQSICYLGLVPLQFTLQSNGNLSYKQLPNLINSNEAIKILSQEEIKIHQHIVKFEKGYIEVGCKRITNEQVMTIHDKIHGKIPLPKKFCVIVKTPEISKLLQEMAFKVGFSWSSGSIQHTDAEVLYFGTFEYITYSDVNYAKRDEYKNILVSIDEAIDRLTLAKYLYINGDRVEFKDNHILFDAHIVSHVDIEKIVERIKCDNTPEN